MGQLYKKQYLTKLEELIGTDNSFYLKGMKDAGADKFESIEIPVESDIEDAVEGTPNLPLQIVYTEDGQRSYSISKFYCRPQLITFEDNMMLDYPKLQQRAKLQWEKINVMLCNKAAYTWGALGTTAGGTNIVPTTGTARATSLVGATGNRKAITKADLLNVSLKFHKMGIQRGNMIAVLTPDQYNDLLGIAEFVDYEKTGFASKLAEGIVGKILGFDIYVRNVKANGSIGLSYTAAGAVKKAANAAVVATDCPAALFFNPDFVRYAQGSPNATIDSGAAGMLGATTIESWVRAGFAQGRGDATGIVSLVEVS